MYKVKDHNIETGEIVERDPTDEELAQYEKDEAERQKAAELTTITLASKTALLEKLGITQDEAKLLLS